MVYESLIRRAAELSSRTMLNPPAANQWMQDLPQRRRTFRRMLGLPEGLEPTNLHVTPTGTVERADYVIEKLHFQPVEGCRVAANVYRPPVVEAPLPAAVYVCGHAHRGKGYYQPHARWFGRHGYVCMVLDPIWAGECGGFHHGVYDKSWWHWYSQGYTPAGVEAWAAICAADYLRSRDDVDGERLGITGNSGGGSTSWFAGAADERFTVVVPSCQTGNAYQHIKDRTVDAHCDCSWWVNTHGWDHTDVAALMAPRPLMVAAQRRDTLFRPYAYRDVVDRVRRLYAELGAAERIALAEDDGQHGYTPATRLAIFSWFDRWLKGSAAPATEDIDDADNSDADLAVYDDGRPPADDRMKEIDTFFTPLPSPPQMSDRAQWQAHQAEALATLKATSFRQFPTDLSVQHVEHRAQGKQDEWAFESFDFETEPGLLIRAHLATPSADGPSGPLIIGPVAAAARTAVGAGGAGLRGRVDASHTAYGTVEVRGTGRTSIGPGLEWTVRRAYPLLGQTLHERRTADLLMGLTVLTERHRPTRTAVFGVGADAAASIYAAVLDERIDAVVLDDPVTTHWNSGPEFLSILKVGDLPHNLALAFPRPILFVGSMPEPYRWVADVYAAHGMAERVAIIDEVSQWIEYV